MNISDYVPHGLITALGGVVAYVFKEHKKQDDDRYAQLTNTLKGVFERQTEISDKMAENHAEILRVLLQSEQQARQNEANAERRG